ncbi:MAG: Kelch repeat-containing protein [Planctomycetota bacterium]|jgi:N-acetylneuraminic acid mutarotase
MKTTKMLTILVLVLGLASVSLAAEGIWTTKSNMPTARYVLCSGVVDGKIYAMGGTTGNGIPNVEEYDPAMDTWTRKARMPMANAAAASSVVNGRIYVIGGRPSVGGAPYSSVIEYDATTDTWTAKAGMPTARSWFSSSVVNGKIYAIGGARTYQGTPLSTVEEYDPATDTWTRKADMPTPRACVSTSAVNGKIYAIGGSPGYGQWYQGLSTVEEYDPATDTWTNKADMPTGRTYLSTSVVHGRIYAIGRARAVEEYDPATDTWTRKADMPTTRSGLATSAVNGKIYAIGGWTGSSTILSTVEEYDPYPLVVDFNGDGIVDCVDMCMMIDHWGTDEPLYDIGPRPFGDGIVDVQDLVTLAELLFTDLRCVAQFKLDETVGSIAQDSAGDHDGTLNGEPVWQPGGGQVSGALAFDGIDDYLSTDFVLNPLDGVFSVFAWIKGGAPGEVIISQTAGIGGAGSPWLHTDPSEGKLMASLTHELLPLKSEFVITDGQWHDIGLVYDGSSKYLYVDGAEVAKDNLPPLRGTDGGLYIGAGENLEPGSFFSGLIDDVRIYNRAITP